MKNAMKKTMFAIGCMALMLLTVEGFSQDDKSKRPSPAATVSEKVKDATVTINYSRPSVKGRTIWGDVVPYEAVWRTGANEATTFEVDKEVKIEGKTLPAGKYALFTIPTEGEWTVIFNKEHEQWGAYNYKESEDALRVNVKPKKASETAEMFTVDVKKNGTVSMVWENLKLEFKVKA